MLAQSYLYINNKKYVTSVSNMDSLMEEVSSFYSQSDNPRSIVLVKPTGDTVMEDSYLDVAKNTISKFNPVITNEGLGKLISFKDMAEVDTLEYLNNEDKVFLVFLEDNDLYSTYFKYVENVVGGVSGFNQEVLKDYAMKVLRRDIDFSFDDDLTDEYILGIIDSLYEENSFHEKVAGVQDSRKWSYDLLFYMNDHMPNQKVSLPLLKEKFSIHSNKLVHEMVQQMAIKTSFVSPIMGILEYLNAKGDMTYEKNALIRGVWQNENRAQALYMLNGFIQYVGTVPGLVDKLKEHESWEYYEVYRELRRSLPLSVAFLEGGFDQLNKDEVRDMWAEIEFLYRRRARIPYLLWSVKPLA